MWQDPLIKSPRWQCDPPARFMPTPTPGARHELQEIARIAEMMGWDLQPWQRRVIRVATEYDLDEEGRRVYRYREIFICVPRQSGKTTLVAPVAILRALLNPRAEIYFSAQSGQYAGDFMKKIGTSYATAWHPALARAFEFLRSNGSEGFRCSNGSIFQRFTRGPEAMHSKSPLLVINDEIWNLSADEGRDLEGAVRPAQSTFGRRAQIWNLSTMGTKQSEYMNALVDTGRAGTNPRMCYIEYSLDPDEDPTDEKLWWDFHPALGNTQTIETLRDDFQKLWGESPGEWERAYCNRLVATDESEVLDGFESLPAAGKPAANVAFAVEVSSREYAACIVAAWTDGDGVPHISVVRQGAGMSWILPTVRQLQQQWPDATVYADQAGRNLRLLEIADLEDVELTPMPLRDRQLADEQFIEAARDLAHLHHDHSPALMDTAWGLKLKTINGLSRFDRDKSITDPMAFIAAAVALYGCTHPVEEHRPMIFV